jgi:C_GCAxxG_C_C family probable redox protein
MMSRKAELVEEKFAQFNCAQTVFCLFAKDLGVNEETALKIASGFGGGMATAETCGAVTGAYMVLGLKQGYSTPDPVQKEKVKKLIRQFNDKFRATHGSLICKELTGYDISTPEGNAEAHQNNVFAQKCTHFIKTSCEILEDHFLNQ